MVASFLISLPVAVATALLLLLGFSMPLSSVLLFGVGAAMFTWAFSIVGFYVYPIYRADKHKRELEDELPFTTGYMSILASAGVSPEKMFYSLSTLNPPLAASNEANEVVKHINLFGLDIISALEKASSRTPSQKLRDMIEGMISTIHTGGNLGAYLREKFKTHMKLKRATSQEASRQPLSPLRNLRGTALDWTIAFHNHALRHVSSGWRRTRGFKPRTPAQPLNIHWDSYLRPDIPDYSGFSVAEMVEKHAEN